MQVGAQRLFVNQSLTEAAVRVAGSYHGQHETVAVVDMLADDVHAARRRGSVGGLTPELLAEELLSLLEPAHVCCPKS